MITRPGPEAQQPVPGDTEAWAIAEDINRQHEHWLVMWGTYSREYVAYPLFRRRQRVIVTADQPADLLTRMQQTEQAIRVQPEGHNRDDATTR
ncbi:MAG TPA: hypothetical protein VGM53_08895 [Streptosporangiaceae bacterium]